MTRSTTEGMNIFAHGFNWKAGDEVLYCTHEHGGGTGAYKNLEKRVGIKIVTIELPSPPQSVDQIVGLYGRQLAANAVHELANILAVGLHGAER